MKIRTIRYGVYQNKQWDKCEVEVVLGPGDKAGEGVRLAKAACQAALESGTIQITTDKHTVTFEEALKKRGFELEPKKRR